MVLGDPLEERQAEQVALTLVDRDREVVVQRIAERVAHEEGPAAVHAEGVDRRIADAVAGQHLRRDCLPLAALAPVDRRRRPCGQRIAGHDRHGDPAEPSLDQLPRRDRLVPGDPSRGMLAGLREQEPQRAGRLRSERDAAAVEAVPDDPHRIARHPWIDHVAGINLEAGELKGGVVGVLERMKRIPTETKLRCVSIGQANDHHGGLALAHSQHLHEPPVGRARDEHLRAREQQSAVAALQHACDPRQVAAGVGLRGGEDGERPPRRKVRQQPRLLLGRTEARDRGDGANRGVHGERAGRRRHVCRESRGRPGEVEHRTATATKCLRNGEPPQAGVAKGLLGLPGKHARGRSWRIGKWGRVVLLRGERLVEPPLRTEPRDLGFRTLEHRLDPIRQRLGRSRRGRRETTVATMPDCRHDPRSPLTRCRILVHGAVHGAASLTAFRSLDRLRRLKHPVMVMPLDHAPLQLERGGRLAMSRVERAVCDHKRLHPPRPRQRRLTSGEPPGKPCPHPRMGDCLTATQDHEPHSPNRGPEHGGLWHHDRRWPPLTRPHHAHLRYRVVLGEGRLHGGRR